MSDQTILLDGHDRTIEEIVKVARYGDHDKPSANHLINGRFCNRG
jgi:hypothetical protein